jgi:hypothetical protein
VAHFRRNAVSRRLLNGEHATFHDVPGAMRTAASHVLAEASAARNDLLTTAAHMAADARAGASAVRRHARRAAAYGSDVAAGAMDSGLEAGAQAWRDARRHAVEWGSVAMKQARSRPAAVLVGVAVIGVAIGFWLRGTSRRANVSTTGASTSRGANARARKPEVAARGERVRKSRSASRSASPTNSAHA